MSKRQFSTLVGFLTSKSSNPTVNDTVEFQGYSAIGDGGTATWQHNGITGQTPSQSPAQLGDALLNDGNGNQWALIFGQIVNFDGTQWFSLPFGNGGTGSYLYDENGWNKASVINDLSTPYIFDTVALFKASLIEFPDGKTIHLNDRDADFTKITGTVTGNDLDILSSNTVDQSIEWITQDDITLSELGVNTATANASLGFNRAVSLMSTKGGGTVNGVAGEVYSLDKTDAAAAIPMDQILGVSLKGNGAELKINNSQECHIVKMIGGASDKATSGKCEISGWVLDGNSANQTDDPSNQDLIRITNSHNVKVFDNEAKNGNSGGIVCDGTDDVWIYGNYVHDIGRNGILVGCSSTVDGERNKAYRNRVVNTGLISLGNGIFFTASSLSVSTNTNQTDPEIFSNKISNAGDIGIEIGIRCAKAKVYNNWINDSLNQAIIIRDNFQPHVYGNHIVVPTGGAGTLSGITADSQLGLGDGNAITISDGKIHDNFINSTDANGIEIKDVSKWNIHDNTVTGVDLVGSVGINIKANDINCHDNNLSTLQRGVRISEQNLTSITGVKVRFNDIDNVSDGVLIESVDLSNSDIVSNSVTGASVSVNQSGTVNLTNVKEYGNRKLDVFSNPGSDMDSYINALDGIDRDSPAAQFGETSIMAPAYSAIIKVRGDNGEMASFAVDGSGPTLTELSSSTSIGEAGSGKDYRVEVNGSNIVFKRYAAAQSIARVKVEF